MITFTKAAAAPGIYHVETHDMSKTFCNNFDAGCCPQFSVPANSESEARKAAKILFAYGIYTEIDDPLYEP